MISPYANFKRKFFPKAYARQGLQQAERTYAKRIRDDPVDKRDQLRSELSWELSEWRDWVQEIEDEDLVAKAERMDVSLDEIPVPFSESENMRSHYELGSFGNRYLCYDSRLALQGKVRERAPAYRKEQREIMELYVKIVTVVLAGATGLLGAATGLIALLKK